MPGLSKIVQLLHTPEECRAAIERLAIRLCNDRWREMDRVEVVVVMNGGVMFAAELLQRMSSLHHAIRIHFVKERKLPTAWDGFLTEDFEDRPVLVLDDIIDTGSTLFRLQKALGFRNAGKVVTALLCDKPHHRLPHTGLTGGYACFEVPDKYIVGFGMDHEDGTLRALPYIGYVGDQPY